MTQKELAAVIERAQQGDRMAVGELYETYMETIYRYVAYRVSERGDIEDLTAEIFVKMIEGLPKYRYTGAPFEAWLYRIAYARIIDFRRRGRHRAHIGLSETPIEGDPNPEEKLEDHQENETLRRALSTLSDEQQHILILRFIERKSHQEVAAVIGKSVSAVKSIQHRALSGLAKQLGSGTKIRHYLRGDQDESSL